MAKNFNDPRIDRTTFFTTRIERPFLLLLSSTMKTSFAAILCLAVKTYAFTPVAKVHSPVTVQLEALNRRDAMGLAFAGLIGAAATIPDEALAANPALETFKGRKPTKGSFIPGKGIRQNESFETLIRYVLGSPSFFGKTHSLIRSCPCLVSVQTTRRWKPLKAGKH